MTFAASWIVMYMIYAGMFQVMRISLYKIDSICSVLITVIDFDNKPDWGDKSIVWQQLPVKFFNTT